MESKRIFKMLLAFYVVVFLFGFPQGLGGQKRPLDKSKLRIPDENHVQILNMEDGSSIIGRTKEVREKEILFESNLGTITVPIEKIREVKEVPASSIKAGKYWFPNPNATRLFFAPTGRALDKGEGYMADYYLFFPMVAYGVTDRITVGGGVSLFPGIGIDKQIFYFTPKVGVLKGEKLNFSAGALLARFPGFFDDDVETAGILYGVATLGSADASFTAGLGYGFWGGDFGDKPMVMMGGEYRASRRVSFVTENWVFPGADEPLISYGIRFFGENLSIDLGFITVLGEGAFFPGIPYIDFVLKF